MLKIILAAEERFSGILLSWWDGIGAAQIFLFDENALLMERALGKQSLIHMAHQQQDDEASQIICSVAAKLHAPRKKPLPELLALTDWFVELAPAANKFGGVLVPASTMANHLLATQHDRVVLHGDIHHANILDFGERGWLAIDPKGLIGERAFDFANIFCNPDFEIATQSGRLLKQLDIVANAAKLEKLRLLQWILAYAGLSAAWTFNDGGDAALALTIAQYAASELSLSF